MNLSIYKECDLFVCAVITGIGFSFLYDQLLVCRKLFKHAKLIIYIEDFFYLLFCFFVSFSLLFYGNNGVLRAYMIIGCAIGISFYFATIGHVYTRLVCRVCHVVMSPVRWLKKRLTAYIIPFTMKMSKYALLRIRKGGAYAKGIPKSKKKAQIPKTKK